MKKSVASSLVGLLLALVSPAYAQVYGGVDISTLDPVAREEYLKRYTEKLTAETARKYGTPAKTSETPPASNQVYGGVDISTLDPVAREEYLKRYTEALKAQTARRSAEEAYRKQQQAYQLRMERRAQIDELAESLRNLGSGVTPPAYTPQPPPQIGPYGQPKSLESHICFKTSSYTIACN